MSTEGWIFMVGFRVFDVGLLVVWLIWFFRMRDDGAGPSDDDDDGGGGGPDRPRKPSPGGGGLRLPLGHVPSGGGRVRDGHRPPHAPSARRHGSPVPSPLPARVRSPRGPARRVTRR